jgi:hypothetical protein
MYDARPFDPNSERGKRIAEELSVILSEIRLAIARRKEAAARAGAANDDAA